MRTGATPDSTRRTAGSDRRSHPEKRGERARTKPPALSVIVPVYDEDGAVTDVVRDLERNLAGLPDGFEILLVDDGSTDGTPDRIADERHRDPDHVRALHHPYHLGNGASIKTGIRAARAPLIAVMDGDGQHRASDVRRMVALMDEFDLVIGARPRGNGGPWHRRIANHFFNRFASVLAQRPIDDLTSGLRMFRADVVRRYVHMFPNRFSTPTTSTLAFLRGGHSVAFVPIEVAPRRNGHSKISIFRDGWRFLGITVKIVVIFAPLRVFMPVASVMFAGGVASSVWASFDVTHPHVPGSSVVMLVVSVLVVLLGLIAEQIAALQVALGEMRGE